MNYCRTPDIWTIAFSLSDLKLYKVDNPVSWIFNVSKTFKPEIFNTPLIFVSLFNVVNPVRFNTPFTFVSLFNEVLPEIFNTPFIFVSLFNAVVPEIFNDDNNNVTFFLM